MGKTRFSLNLKLITGTAIVVTCTMAVSYYLITKHHETLIHKYLHNQAKSLFKQITFTRKWITDHLDLNGFIQFQQKLPDKGEAHHATENPAIIIKELSKYAEEEGLYWFRTTSLKLTNPNNMPDDFERESLMAFDSGSKVESFKIEKIGNKFYYRYMGPLYIEQDCLACHIKQGYKIGDIRGGLSIAIPMDFSLAMIDNERKGMVLAIIITIITLIIFLYIMLNRFVISPVLRLRTSIDAFSDRGKSILPDIRTGDELEDLSTSFINMSKSLNDYHAHLEDMVHAATKDLEDANRTLVELNKRKSDFVAKVSHELRTPLTSIRGAMDYLTARFSSSSYADSDMQEVNTFISVIKNNAERLVRMVNDTLDLERIESGALDMHYSHVNILNMVKEVATTLHIQASAKRITFKLISKPDTVVLADEDRIRQVMINLFSNAIMASPPDSEVQVSVSDTDSAVVVSVKNEGEGIPDNEHLKVFDKFYTRSSKDGSGLGLAICKGIIEAHHGTIKVANNFGKRECTFIFTLPKAKKDN